MPSSPPHLLDQVRHAIRRRHYSPRTEEAYVTWIRRFILSRSKRHPRAIHPPRRRPSSPALPSDATPPHPHIPRGWSVMESAGHSRSSLGDGARCLPYRDLRLLDRGAGGHAAGQVRRVGRAVAGCPLNHDRIAQHVDATPSSQPVRRCCSVFPEPGHRSACRQPPRAVVRVTYDCPASCPALGRGSRCGSQRGGLPPHATGPRGCAGSCSSDAPQFSGAGSPPAALFVGTSPSPAPWLRIRKYTLTASTQAGKTIVTHRE